MTDISPTDNSKYTEAPDMTSLQPGTMPELQFRADFEKVLDGYKLSPEAQSMLQETKLVLVVSVTAAGRNTIIERLLKTGKYYNLVSDTTRPMRIKDGQLVETHGKQYFFRPEEDILEDLQGGKFIEAALIHNQQVSGISVREVVRAHESGKIAITDVEVNGCETILNAKPNTIPIFVLPPNFTEWLRRINFRSQLPKAELRNRMETALDEFEVALEDERFIFVINDELERAVHVVDEVAEGHIPSDEANENARNLAAQLRAQVEEYLETL